MSSAGWGWLSGYFKFEAAIGHMSIYRYHSPTDSIFPGFNSRQRARQESSILRIYFRVSFINLGSLAIENLDFTQRGFQSLSKPDLHCTGWRSEFATYRWFG